MFGVWIENFSEVHCMSFDPSCWALVLAIWEGRLKVASRPTVRNQVIETFFWRPFFGPPPQCAFHLLWSFMLGLGCDHIRDGLVSGCRKPSCWNVISNSFLWPAFRITVLKQFCGCWGSGLNFFGMHCISFDPSCWSSAVAIWNADMKMAPRHGLRMLQKIIGIRGPTKPFKMMHRSTWFGAAGRGAILMPKPLTATARAYHKIKGKESRPPK